MMQDQVTDSVKTLLDLQLHAKQPVNKHALARSVALSHKQKTVNTVT